MKSLTKFVSEGFIWGVGITRPNKGKEGSAGLFITGMLVGVILAAGAVFLFISHMISR